MANGSQRCGTSRHRLVKERTDSLEIPSAQELIGGTDEMVGIVRSFCEVRRVVEGRFHIAGRALIELDGLGQDFIHPGLGQLGMVFQVADQGAA